MPLVTPMWTVTMPLSIFPTHPRYWRWTPGVWSPHLRQLVSSMTPTVPRGSPGRSATAAPRCFCKVSRAEVWSQRAVTRNSWRVRTAIPASSAIGSMLLRGRSDSSPRQ